MLRKSVLVLAAALVVLGTLASGAQAFSRRSGVMSKWWQIPGVARDLALTQAEKDQLGQMNLQLRRQLINQRGAIQKARLAIDAQFDQQALDHASIERELTRLAKAQTAIAIAKSRFMLKVRQMLGLKRFRKLRYIFDSLSGRPSRVRRD